MEIKSINSMKIIASIFVLFIHSKPFTNTRVLGIDGYYFSVFLTSIARFAVPFFFMVSGYFLYKKLNKNPSFFKFFKSNILKLWKIHLFLGIFYFSFEKIIFGRKIYEFNYKLLKLFFIEGLYYHLWFIPALAINYLLIYLAFKKKKENEIFVISLILNILGLFGENQIYSQIIKIPFVMSLNTRNYLFFGLFYIMLGYIIARERIEEKKISNFKYLLLIVLLNVSQILERIIGVKFFKSPKGGDYFISTIFLSIFLLCFLLTNKNKLKNFSIYGKYANKVYFFHPVSIIVLTKILDSFSINESQIIYHIILNGFTIIGIIMLDKCIAKISKYIFKNKKIIN